jgi:hypothetical protein
VPSGAHPGASLVPSQDSSLGRIGIALHGAIGGDPVGQVADGGDGGGDGGAGPGTGSAARTAGGLSGSRQRSLAGLVPRFAVDPNPAAIRAQALSVVAQLG